MADAVDETARLASTFDDASGDFDRLTPTLWGPAGQALIFQLGPGPGATVLDVCCGAGASALPAAAAVGPTGRVHAIDVADDLLEIGRLVAAERALQNIDFVCADATTWEPPSAVPEDGYDALAVSYGVFLLPRMDATFDRLVGLVRHGGRVGVTVWRAGAMEEISATLFDVVGLRNPAVAGRPSLRDRTPLHTIDLPRTLEAWLAAAGTHSVEVRTLSNLLPATDELCWALVTGSGLRAVLAGLDADAVAAVRAEFLAAVTERGIHTIDATTLVGTATVRRPPATV
ncbi:class I SAM-dependent methyltransferase [Rhodococcus sp. A5(2022)]|uniref:class I SAM-dependent methyltransferase n=1 Tax=Rhodococcus sp. A5(2022) TaxID=3003588 RepID=UPI0022A86EB6|nr:class I SAM-dependent methyltransferase [Rhodococcus sp. A5(2022)]MCZ1071042.1 class I SAM-dependent methyltransferase [Rhodococcus sp. A5(2022)]